MKEICLQRSENPRTSLSSPNEYKRVLRAAHTRQKLLEAAAVIFARHGFQGATTREIAREAGVNEMTLFRHFHSREELLNATLKRFLSDGIRDEIANYARECNTLLEQNEPIFRGLTTDARMLPESTRQTIMEIVSPCKARLVALLSEGQKAGLVRTDLDIACAAEMLRACLQAGALRHIGFCPINYLSEMYLQTVTDVFVRGLRSSRVKQNGSDSSN